MTISTRASLLIGALFLAACGEGTESSPDAPVVTVFIPDGSPRGCEDGGCLDAGGGGATCGDGVVTPGLETCDDGNLLGGDGCSPNCQKEACGDFVVGQGEDCEPPGSAACSVTCRRVLTSCGDGTMQMGESCDDGNDRKGDGCFECRKECGDGRLDRDIGEECEPQFSPKDSNGVSTTCTDDCKRKPFCGDGKVNTPDEQCEPVNGTTCIDNCKRAPSPQEDAGVACVPRNTDGGVGSPPSGPNLLANGSFGSDLAGWEAGPAVTATHVTDHGGAARVAFQAAQGNGLSVDGIARCVAVAAKSLYDVEARYWNPAGQASGVGAFAVVLLYRSSNCTGAPVSPAGMGTAVSRDTDKWLSYKLTVDANRAGEGTQGMVSISLKLGVVVPGGQSGAALWDEASVRVAGADGNCGNCKVDPGETCDDGNLAPGDGCSARCQSERTCGNGAVDPGEECDEGATSFTGAGTCTPLCTRKSACDTCAVGMCRTQVDACLGLTGAAEAGPGKGEPRSLLCGRLRQCVQRSGCNGATAISTRKNLSGAAGVFLENCYCGTGGEVCQMSGKADGSCRAEVEAALETTDPTLVLQRVGGADARYPVFGALRDLLECEKQSCAEGCVSEPTCGNGVIQERTAAFVGSFQLEVGGKKEACADDKTPSKKGCSFEECDGGPMCDPNCFQLRCGNGLKQAGEDCDDGNTTAGDGCSDTCKAEFTCGDGMVATKFGEECDPPGAGKLCTQAEYMSDASACGCGSTCKRTWCGNQIVDAGEECDPPDGATCGSDCKRVGLPECIQCLLLNTKGTNCQSKLFLEGHPDLGGYGCLGDQSCFKALTCRLDKKCALSNSPLGCYCGDDGDLVQKCTDQSDFVPMGPCKAEEEAAYTSQFGAQPTHPPAFVMNFTYPPEAGKPPALFVANTFIDCLGAPGLFEAELKESGVADDKVQSCATACRGK